MSRQSTWLMLIPFLVLASSAGAAPSATSVWSSEGDGAFDFSATSVGTAGDFNCDGVADLMVGIPKDDERTCPSCSSADSGTIKVWFGSANNPPAPDPFARPDWFTYLGNFDGNLGNSVAAGDVNGDGCDDVIATEHFPGFSLISPQKVHVFLGPVARITRGADSAQPSPDLPEWTATLFQRTTSGGTQSPPSVAAGDVNGDGLADVIVGQPEASNGQSEEGVVLVWLGKQNFADIADGTTANADWMAESDQANAHLGESVASAFDFNGDGRDEVLAGAPDYNGHGWAFLWLGSPVFESIANGTPANKSWSLTLASPGSRLGQSVSAAGDFDGDGFGDLLVGAPLHDAFNSYTDSGEALLVRGGNPMPASDIFSFYFGPINVGGQLGTSVSTAGDVNGDGLGDILVGEPGVTLGTGRAGQVHLILGIRGYTGTLTARPAIDVTYSEAGTINAVGDKARYGAATGTAGDWNADGFSDLIIGAPSFGISLWGKAYVYLGRGETLAVGSHVLGASQSASGHGLGLGFAGDINRDGFSDAVTGAPNYESTASQSGEGRFFVTYGSTCGPSFACGGPVELLIPGQREGEQAGAALGTSVTGAGDVNGDGYADVIAGAPTFDGETLCGPPIFFCPVPDSGMAQVYMGGSGGLAASPSVILQQGSGLSSGGQAGAQYGFSVSSAGDVNGDGYSDALVGAPRFSSGPANDGRVYLYLGSASGLNATPVWVKSGGQAGARLGIALAAAGDVNRDGYGDVIIGADGYGGTGAAFVYLGQAGGLKPNPVRTYLGAHAGSSFGLSVGTAGDVNRDGFADVVVGSPTHSDEPGFEAHRGLAYVFHGGANGPSASANTVLWGDVPQNGEHRFGSGVSTAGDVNGDGFGDLIVGDQWWSGDGFVFAMGKAYVFHGGPSGLSTTAARTFNDCPNGFCDFGRDVSGGHDMNGDGFSDVLVAAYGSDLILPDGGDVFLHMGNEARGTPLRPLQGAGIPGAPRALLGITSNWIEASMDLRSPAGRSRVQLELEIEPLGTNFDGLATTRGLFFDSGVIGRDALYELRAAGGVYHWRARLRSRSPLFGRGRWVSLPGNAPREADFRTFSDSDLDGTNNAADVCPHYAQTSNADSDGDARGNQCECGDQNGDGFNTVADIVAINAAIFNPALISPLCDANNDALCTVSDMVAVNLEIFSPTSTSTCARQPFPQP